MQIKNMYDVFKEYPEMKDIIGAGACSVMLDEYEIFRELVKDYIFYRLSMFINIKNIMEIDKNEGEKEAVKFLFEEFKRLGEENEILKPENLETEYKIQIISYILNNEYIMFKFRDLEESEIEQKIKMELDFLKLGIPIRLTKKELEHLLPLKRMLKSKLSIIESDFKLNFREDSLVMKIK